MSKPTATFFLLITQLQFIPARLFLFITVSLVTSHFSHAQQRRRDEDTSHYRTVPVPAHLMPIERAYGSSSLGSVYFYGGKSTLR